jgi:FMN phosphatase YigB (HAD superfamily)
MKPEQLVFIDDLSENIAVATSLGWRGIVFQDAAQCSAALELELT